MLKNNQNSQPQSNNSNYLSWFVRDSQDLKRGGTAPIMPSRKSRPAAHNDASQDNDSTRNNEQDSKNIPVITTSYGNSHPLNQSRGGGTPTGESHRITKVAHPSGVSVYRLTKKKSITSESNNSQLPYNAFEALNNGLSSPNQKPDRRHTPGLPSHEDLSSKDLQDTPLSFMSPGISSSSFNARPGSSHFKGGSAFRRTRILNESSQNNEEFQTPNTGNLDLESLNNLNNQSTGRDSSPPTQSKHDLRSAQEGRIGVNLRQPMTRQNDAFENELDNIAQLKNFNEARIPQRGPFKGRYGAFGNEDNHDNKAVRVMTADLKTKPKPVIEGRRYAEDVEALNISDEDDDGFKTTANSRPSAAKEQQTKESLVSIIGRNMQGERETQPKKNERHDDEENIFNRNAQKFTLDFGDSTLDSNLTPHQRGFAQRPPARKNGQAMNLDDRSMQSEKKPLMMSPGQEQHFERPPSRHKIPTKALGLDLPEEPVKSTPMGILQNHERETPVQKRETVTAAAGRRANNLRTGDSDFEFENNDFENLNFNKVLDLSDFLEGEEAPQNQSRSHAARPKTTAGAQRDSFQSNQPSKNQGIGIGIGKHVGLQSAKGRPISGLGHNPLLSSKLEAFNNMRNNRSAKESRLETAYNPSKETNMKSKLTINNDHDLDNCDVYNMESDSDSFEASLSNRKSFNNTNGISRNQSGSKLWGQEKGSKKEGLQLSQNMFKDKKSQIVFIHNKGSQSTKKENIDLPFETTLEKDFVGLFAN